MAGNLEIEYRGYAVRFNENSERWSCSALDLDGDKLAGVKAKIDRIVAASRKLAEPLPAFHVDYNGNIKPVRITAFAQPKKASAEPDSVWVITPTTERYYNPAKVGYDYREVEGREKRSLASLYADTPENREAIREIERLKAAKKQIDDKIKATQAGMLHAGAAFKIPPVDADQEAI